MRVRVERPDDAAAVFTVNATAFESDADGSCARPAAVGNRCGVGESCSCCVQGTRGRVGGCIGARRADWIDVLLWGHQITLHCRPDEIVREQGRRHFGVVLPWQDWEAFGTRPGIGPTLISHEGTTREQRKIYLEDPDDYVIEIKSYRDVEAALELGGPA